MCAQAVGMNVFHYPCTHSDSPVLLFAEKGKGFFPQLLFNSLGWVFLFLVAVLLHCSKKKAVIQF